MPEEKHQFVYTIKPYKENFAATMTEEEANIMGTHFLYLKDLLEKGI